MFGRKENIRVTHVSPEPGREHPTWMVRYTVNNAVPSELFWLEDLGSDSVSSDRRFRTKPWSMQHMEDQSESVQRSADVELTVGGDNVVTVVRRSGSVERVPGDDQITNAVTAQGKIAVARDIFIDERVLAQIATAAFQTPIRRENPKESPETFGQRLVQTFGRVRMSRPPRRS